MSKVIEAYLGDTARPLSFKAPLDCSDQSIIVKLYKDGTLVDTINSTPPGDEGSVIGDTHGTEIAVPCDFSDPELEPGSDYTITFSTEEIGLLAKSFLILFAEDGFTSEPTE